MPVAGGRFVVGFVMLALAAGCTIDEQDVVTAPLGGDDIEAGVDDRTAGAIRTHSGDGPDLTDHWHVAYGFFFCDSYVPALSGETDPLGIHTHGDGVIHVHPFTDEATGDRAVIGLFFDSAGVSVTDDALELPDGAGRLPVRGSCDGEPARLHLIDFGSVDRPGAPVPTVGTPSRIAKSFVGEDRTAFAIAFVADPEDVPPPVSIADLDTLSDVPQQAPADLPGGTATPPLDEGFGLQPVLASIPDATCALPFASTPDGECLSLAQPVEGVAVERADAVLGPSPGQQWVVDLVLTTGGIDAFNAMAQRCFDRSEPCTSGRLAIVVDGDVVTAPTIHVPTFERDAIQISGAFSEAEARALAASITN